MEISIILGFIALLVMAEGLFIVFYPKETRKMMTSLGRNLKMLRRVGIIEILIGIAILLFSIMGRNS